MIVLLSVLVTVSFAHQQSLNAILRSPKETLNAYGEYKAKQHLYYGGSEDKMRLGVWRRSAEMVARENSRLSRTVELELNKFAVMTSQERRQYLGFNATTGMKATPVKADAVVPEEKNWIDEGKVTVVKDQARCGSCWTFGAVGGLETRYALMDPAGTLRNFAEKEYLDCVYEGSRDGCNGGWMQDCYQYSADNGGRLASTADYPYYHSDGQCLGSSKKDAMVSSKITGYIKVGETEKDNIAAIAEGSITVAFEATDFFMLYKTGLMKDMTCTGSLNHAVVAVGYTKKYILVKNSWGDDWGEKGYVRYMRGHHNCGLYEDSYYPQLTATDQTDSGSDKASDYKAPDNDDTFDPKVCADKYIKCTWVHCRHPVYSEKYCAKTCNKCPQDDGCPKGTILCSDNVCRHKHMCP